MRRWHIALVILGLLLVVAWLTRARWAPLLMPKAETPQPELPAGGTQPIPVTPAGPPLQDQDPPPAPAIRRVPGAALGALGAR